jgi:hypothetical protein
MFTLQKETKKAKKEKAKVKRQTEIKLLAMRQKLRLALSSMHCDDWETAISILKTQDYCPGTYPPIATVLCGRIEHLIWNLYKPYYPLCAF